MTDCESFLELPTVLVPKRQIFVVYTEYQSFSFDTDVRVPTNHRWNARQ
jgi:hypothetical protein